MPPVGDGAFDGTLLSGDVFGEGSLLTSRCPSPCTVVARESCLYVASLFSLNSLFACLN